MARLLQIFGFLSVLFRGGTLTFEALTLGGIFFLNFVLPRASSPVEAILGVCSRWIRRAALALATMQLAYILASSLILMQSADMSLKEVSGANFFLAGMLAIASALAVAVLADVKSLQNRFYMLLPAVLILISSVMTSHAMARRLGSEAFSIFSSPYRAPPTWNLPASWLRVSRKPP